MSESKPSCRVGVDVGGTFTDVTVLEEGTGRIREVRKVPSNPAAPLEVLDGVLADLRAKWGADALSYLLHGSTHALNTVLEEKGARTGLLTTRGFRDIYEIARQWKGHEVFNIFYPGAKRFVPRRRVAEVAERLDKSGDVLVPLDLGAVDEAVAGLMEQGIDALAVAFLFSYVNPEHERLAAEHIRSRHTGPLRRAVVGGQPGVARVRAHRYHGAERLPRPAHGAVFRRHGRDRAAALSRARTPS